MSKDKTQINELISAPEVRLIDHEGNQVGVVSSSEALEMARAAGLDLVEVSPNAKPPVCKIIDYGKFKFQQSKQKAAAKKKQKQIQVKEIKLRPGTEEGDYQVKLRNLKRFLDEGDKVKVTIRFRGREMAHNELGAKMLQRIEADLTDLSTVEHRPKLEGRQMVMVLSPTKKK